MVLLGQLEVSSSRCRFVIPEKVGTFHLLPNGDLKIHYFRSSKLRFSTAHASSTDMGGGFLSTSSFQATRHAFRKAT